MVVHRSLPEQFEDVADEAGVAVAGDGGAGMIPRVNGMRTVNVLPSPGIDETTTVPPSFSIVDRTMSRPTPRPERLVTAAAVEKPGVKMSACSPDPQSAWRERSC